MPRPAPLPHANSALQHLPEMIAHDSRPVYGRAPTLAVPMPGHRRDDSDDS